MPSPWGRKRTRKPAVRRLGAEPLESRTLLTVLPAGFREEVLVSGLSYPTAMAIAPDGRIFVAQKGGGVRVIKDGALLPRQFTFVPAEASYEYGLCGIALDPDFATNGYVYLNYITQGSPTRSLIERFTAKGDVAEAGSRTTIFELDTVNPPGPTGNYHVGGAMHFGGDGKLYVATGDNTVPANAQSLGSLHGKILRINKDGSIPADNPFFSTAVGNNRSIWAYGLRNAFTFAVQPGSGRILINDVGQNLFEEINLGRPGANYGWPLAEGPTTDPRYDAPLYAYAHLATEKGAACIAGGTFYDPAVVAMPSTYIGRYFFADFNNAWMATLDPASGQATMFATELSEMPLDIDVGPDGNLYYLAWGNGMSVSRISYTGDLKPSISVPPRDVTTSVGQSATFAVSATGDGVLSYRWQRAAAGRQDFTDIPNAAAATLTLPSVAVADSGARYRVVVSSLHGAVTSAAVTLTVLANRPPVVTVLSPPAGAMFSGGESMAFTASATDPETGPLPSAAIGWQVDMLHGAVARPLVPPTTGSSGAFVIPDETPYTRTDVIVRLTVTARDPISGILGTATVDYRPRLSTLSLHSDPMGLVLGLQGEPNAAPYATEAIVGFRRTISAAPFQVAAGGFQRFIGWAHGGAASQVVTVPASDVTYTARYVASTAYVETFASGQGTRFVPRSGVWSMDAAGGYEGTRDPQADGAVSTFKLETALPATYEIGAVMGLGTKVSNGFLIFDVVAPNDFKYVGLRGFAGMLVAGRRTPAGWQDEVSILHGLDATTARQLTVRVSGTAVTARLGERHFLTHNFGESLADGGIGLATKAGGARFGRFLVNTAAVEREVFATATSLRENNVPGQLVGILGTRGWGYGATFGYELVPGEGAADNGLFRIEGDRLLAIARFNHEMRQSYSIRVRSTEANGIVSEQQIAISVLDDPDEPPVIETLVGPDAGVYRAGTVLRFTLILSRAVTVTGRPELPFRLAGTSRSAVYEAGAGTNRLTFAYTVRATDPSGDVVVGSAIRLPTRSSGIFAAAVRLAPAVPMPGAVMPGVWVDTLAPRQVGLLEAPPAGTYRPGSVIRFRVTFSEPVHVFGTPVLRLSLGGGKARTVAAAYESGSGTGVLTFAYQVQPSDAMRAGSWLQVSNAIVLPPGAAVVDAALNPARLALRVPTGMRVRFVA